MKLPRKFYVLSFLGMLLILVIFWSATQISNDESLQRIVGNFGFLGIVLVAMIAGLNLVLPIHAASFTPIFLASGFAMPVIIAGLVIGTTVADLLSYVLGHYGKNSAEKRYPTMHSKVSFFVERKKHFVLPGVFLYSAFAPLPNEVVMLPLGLLGYSLRKIIIPLILGTFIHHTIFVLGFKSIFDLIV